MTLTLEVLGVCGRLLSATNNLTMVPISAVPPRVKRVLIVLVVVGHFRPKVSRSRSTFTK